MSSRGGHAPVADVADHRDRMPDHRSRALAAGALGANRIVNLPGISVTAGEMAAALGRVAGSEVAGRIRWERDDRIERIVASWPGACDTTRALALGFPGDESFQAIIRAYMKDELGGA